MTLAAVALPAGWNSNQVVAGVLVQTQRNTVRPTCQRRFDKFSTKCTEQSAVYDGATGEAVAVATTSGGLQPYGVDAVFLADSAVYDSKLVTGKHRPWRTCMKALKYAEHTEHAVTG